MKPETYVLTILIPCIGLLFGAALVAFLKARRTRRNVVLSGFVSAAALVYAGLSIYGYVHFFSPAARVVWAKKTAYEFVLMTARNGLRHEEEIRLYRQLNADEERKLQDKAELLARQATGEGSDPHQ